MALDRTLTSAACTETHLLMVTSVEKTRSYTYTLDAAEKASTEKVSFRAVCFLPLTDDKLETRLQHPRARLLVKFPDNSVPFIPHGYWYGGRKTRGCYQQKHTRMVLIMYESEDIGELQPVNNDTLQQKLAAWFINKTPVRNHVVEKLRYTGIPLAYYNIVLRARFPESWKFWKHGNHIGSEAYHGAPHDTTHINQTPFKDVTNRNRMLAHVGHLLDTFDQFLRELGIPARHVKSTTAYVEQTMKAHTVKIFKMFWKAARDGGDQPAEPVGHEDNDNESETGEEAEDLASPEQEQEHAWMARSDTDSSATDEDTTSDESDLGSDEGDEDDNLEPPPRPSPHASSPTQLPQPGREALESARGSPTVARKEPATITQHPPAAQRNKRGVGLDKGGTAWLNLEQVASIIQRHNTHHSIVTTLLQGLGREHWNTVWTHMRAAEEAALEGTGRPAPRIRDTMLRYGQLLFKHKRDGISGIYPMKIPGHWRVMIVSHVLREVVLLDPFGDEFTVSEFDNVKYSYSGYTISTWTQRLQTDGWNCGVWVAWIASLWTTHVERGLEGTMSINEVIQEGLSAEGIRDTNTHPSGTSHNESCILRIRKRFRRMIYADSHPTHLTTWLADWNTPLREVQAVSAVTHLAQVHRTAGTTTPQHEDLTEDASETHSADPPPPPSGGVPPPPPGGTLARPEPRKGGGKGQPLNPQGRHNGDIPELEDTREPRIAGT